MEKDLGINHIPCDTKAFVQTFLLPPANEPEINKGCSISDSLISDFYFTLWFALAFLIFMRQSLQREEANKINLGARESSCHKSAMNRFHLPENIYLTNSICI